ncbi:MAG: zf-HC2 domain-containing protein [Armatimonas sp.]
MSTPFEEIQPCYHMTGLLSQLADGTLSGLSLWYARQHVAGCAHCRDAHGALVTLREHLANLGNSTDSDGPRLSQDRRSALEAALDALEKESEITPV